MSMAHFTTDPVCEFVQINGVLIDYFGHTSHETISEAAKVRFDAADGMEIERTIESRVLFYDAKIVLCSIHQFSKYYWALNREYDNLRLVQLNRLDKTIGNMQGICARFVELLPFKLYALYAKNKLLCADNDHKYEKMPRLLLNWHRFFFLLML